MNYLVAPRNYDRDFGGRMPGFGDMDEYGLPRDMSPEDKREVLDRFPLPGEQSKNAETGKRDFLYQYLEQNKEVMGPKNQMFGRYANPDAENIGREKYFSKNESDDSQTIRDIGEDLRRFMSMTGPLNRLRGETTAQKYAADYLSRKGYSDDEIRAMDAGDLGRYPFSYVKGGFDYREGNNPMNYMRRMPDANTVDFSKRDMAAQNLGDLYATPGYLETKDQITQEALDYLEGSLGRFTEAGNKSPREIYTRTIFDR